MKDLKEALTKEYDDNFERYWKSAFSAYKNDAIADRVWFCGPTSYLFSLAGKRFAVDLQIRRACDFEKLRATLADDTSKLEFVLITHQHDDHMCIPLMRELKDSPIIWYIPDGTHENLIAKTELPEEKIVRVRSGDSFKIGDITVKVFKSTHERPDEEQIFEQVGYEIVTPRGKLLFPADVRNYDSTLYPDFSDIDICFAHLWAGDDTINAENYMPLLCEFADFYSRIGAKKYFLCHLYEIARELRHMWRYTHAGAAMELFIDKAPTAEVMIPHLGSSYALFD